MEFSKKKSSVGISLGFSITVEFAYNSISKQLQKIDIIDESTLKTNCAICHSKTGMRQFDATFLAIVAVCRFLICKIFKILRV